MKETTSYGVNMAEETRKVRIEERLKIKIGEAKNLPARSHGAPSHRDTYCVLSLDQEEIFRTSTMERTLDPFFGEEFQFEVPRRFRYLSIYVFDRDKHLKQDRVLGKVAIKREDLHLYNNKDHWFALRAVDADSEVQGKAHIELTFEDSRRRMRVEPKPPDPDPGTPDSAGSAKGKANLSRLSEYCKESMRFGTCSSSTSKKFLSTAVTEPSLALSRSESLKDRQQWTIRTKPPLHAMSEPQDSSPSPSDYWSDPERHCADRTDPDVLLLRILECSELTTKNGQCDPYALVTIHYSNGKRIDRRTKSRKKTVNPQFDEVFCFELLLETDQKDKDGSHAGWYTAVAVEARVSVWHDAAAPAFLGEVRLPLRQPSGAPSRAWYFLSSRWCGAGSGGGGVGGGGSGGLCRGATPPGTRLSAAALGAGGAAALGSVRLLLQYTVDHVFPLHHYQRLAALFLNSVQVKPITASAVYILGEIVSSKTDAAQPLVRLLTHHDLIVPAVRELADAEISALTDATTIFRGNTLVSKMMDEAMRVCGAAYLRGVLRPTLAAVLAERRPAEIDPARLKHPHHHQQNLANLKDYVERVFEAITSSYGACPPLMRRLFDALRQCAAKHFPRNAEVRYSVVSGFIFLRFFAPAILGPKLFDLTTEQIDPQTNRTLTLISKTIQSLGNLVSSRSAQQVCKEEYMAALYASFCTPRHVQAIRQFLEIISTGSDTQNNNVQETPVLLKEGTMIKRSEGIRAGSAATTPPRRRWTRAAQQHAKRRHFRLTSCELSWSRCGSKSGARRLSLAGVLCVSMVEQPAAGAPIGANNIFQIVHRERVLHIQASNCVERAEWVRLLTALTRRPDCAPLTHGGLYTLDDTWTCCGRVGAEAEGCSGGEDSARGEGAANNAGAGGAVRLDPARDLQRLHALLVAHAKQLEDKLHKPHESVCGDASGREAELSTLRELHEAMFELELKHRVYRRDLARHTKYGSKQAPIGDDNYLHLAATHQSPPYSWRTQDSRMNRNADERLSGKSSKSASGYLTMSCLRHEPSEDSDSPPDRPPKPTLQCKSICEYVDMEPKPPERRPKEKKALAEQYRCKEYELMANYMSNARCEPADAPPAVPPRTHHASPKRLSTKIEEPTPKAYESVAATSSAPHHEADVTNYRDCYERISFGRTNTNDIKDNDLNLTDDSLLDLQKDSYCVLKVCEEDIPDSKIDENLLASSESVKQESDKEECGIFSRISFQRKSNPTKSQNCPPKIKTSNSTSNVFEVSSHPSKPISERFTPFFFKKKKPTDESQPTKSSKKDDNLIGRLTPRFGQSRLYSRGQSLDLNVSKADSKRIERSATTVSMPPTRPLNSSIVANFKFLSLHRYGPQDEIRGQSFTQNKEESMAIQPSSPESNANEYSDNSNRNTVNDSFNNIVKSDNNESVDINDRVLEYVIDNQNLKALVSDRRSVLAASTNDIRL